MAATETIEKFFFKGGSLDETSKLPPYPVPAILNAKAVHSYWHEFREGDLWVRETYMIQEIHEGLAVCEFFCMENLD